LSSALYHPELSFEYARRWLPGRIVDELEAESLLLERLPLLDIVGLRLRSVGVRVNVVVMPMAAYL
jgi:hypothetical protein